MHSVIGKLIHLQYYNEYSIIFSTFATNEIPTVAKVREEFQRIYTDFDASWETFRYVISVDFFSSSLLFSCLLLLAILLLSQFIRKAIKKAGFSYRKSNTRHLTINRSDVVTESMEYGRTILR